MYLGHEIMNIMKNDAENAAFLQMLVAHQGTFVFEKQILKEKKTKRSWITGTTECKAHQ